MVLARGILIGLISALPPTASAQELGAVAPDTPNRTGNVEVVCTGVSLDARQNPAWAGYPLKIEVAGRGGQYLGDVHLILSQQGKALVSLKCDGPWILFQVATGQYQVEAQTEGKTVSSSAFVPVTGQGRVILRFPELGGETSPSTAADMPSGQSVGQ